MKKQNSQMLGDYALLANFAYADSFKCYRIVDGEYTGGHITV